ncbi:septum formation family protein [Tessaracoccus sp. G1721]
MAISRSITRRLPALLAVAIVVTGLAGCSGTATRDGDSQEVTEAGTADVFSLRVGDCFNDTTDEEISDVPAVPCAEAHDNEVYHSFVMPDGEFPGQAAIDAAIEETCLSEFESFVGMAYDVSTLDIFPLTPTEQGWDELADREIICTVYDPAGQTSGSLKGAAR